ncbi:hypothetical protein NOCA2550030 [metagenome]|uniref:Uncharacterized protein n=1 Tax=metagenome TaxID=256318 RepID=A0A2P2CAG9_9ZZZZ
MESGTHQVRGGLLPASGPQPQTMASDPLTMRYFVLAHESVSEQSSAPACPLSRSLPGPPRRRSSPLPPSRVSSPRPPKRVSRPDPPATRSSPAPPSTQSEPAPPSTVSSPGPASMVSLPPLPRIRSSPPRPRITSSPGVPSRRSSPAVPMMVTPLVVHPDGAAVAGAATSPAPAHSSSAPVSERWRMFMMVLLLVVWDTAVAFPPCRTMRPVRNPAARTSLPRQYERRAATTSDPRPSEVVAARLDRLTAR